MFYKPQGNFAWGVYTSMNPQPLALNKYIGLGIDSFKEVIGKIKFGPLFVETDKGKVDSLVKTQKS